MNLFISSFKRARRWAWGLIAAAVLFGAVEVAVFRNLDFYGIQPYSFVGQLSELEHSFELADPEKVQTAVFGDSQSIDALRPDYMSSAIGRDSGSMFNFSISGGKAYDIYHTYLSYRDKLPRLQQAIVVVNEHQISDNGIDKDAKFRYYAGLQDRFRVMDQDNYGELLLGWVSKAFDMRTIWSPMFDAWRKDKLPDRPVWKPGGIRAKMERDELTAAKAEATAGRWFQDYDTDGVQAASLEALLRDLQARGVKTVVLQLPRSSLFETAVQKLYPSEQRNYVQVVSELAHKYGASFEMMSNAGLPYRDYFRDTNHLNPKGAAIVSKEVAERWLGAGG